VTFQTVWVTRHRAILNKYLRGSNAGRLELHIRTSFLDLWADLGSLAGTGEANSYDVVGFGHDP